jgi:hypothetical protein
MIITLPPPQADVNHAGILQQAVDTVAAAGGGTVVVPGGQTYLTGAVRMKSNVTLHLEAGARLLASPDIADYENWNHRPLFAQADFCRFWIWAFEAENVAITGAGTLDGNSDAFVKEKRPENTIPKNPRAQSVVFIGCRKVRIRDITIRNAPSWALRPAGCTDVVIDGVSIYNDLGLVNSDGIDPDCSKNVRITNCTIETGDDGISPKARAEVAERYGGCENILVTGCTIRASCAALRIGTETAAPIRNVIVSHCVIHDSHRGIVIDGRDGDGLIENVIFRDLVIQTKLSHPVWWHEGEPIYICEVPRPGVKLPAQLRNVRFSGITIESEGGVYVQGVPGRPPEGIVFEDVTYRYVKQTAYEAGKFDPRPCDPDFKPSGTLGEIDRTPWGTLLRHDTPAFFIEHARGVTLRRCRVTWGEDMPAVYSHALEVYSVEGLTVEDFVGHAARDGILDQVMS